MVVAELEGRDELSPSTVSVKRPDVKRNTVYCLKQTDPNFCPRNKILRFLLEATFFFGNRSESAEEDSDMRQDFEF